MRKYKSIIICLLLFLLCGCQYNLITDAIDKTGSFSFVIDSFSNSGSLATINTNITDAYDSYNTDTKYDISNLSIELTNYDDEEDIITISNNNISIEYNSTTNQGCIAAKITITYSGLEDSNKYWVTLYGSIGADVNNDEDYTDIVCTFSQYGTTLRDYYIAVHEDVYNKAINNSTKLYELFDKGGKGFLVEDITLPDNLTLTVKEGYTVELCLNGHTLNLNDNSILVNGVLNISDCKDDKHYFDIDNEQNGIWVISDEITDNYVEGGVIYNGKHSVYGAILVNNELTMDNVNVVGFENNAIYVSLNTAIAELNNCCFYGNILNYETPTEGAVIINLGKCNINECKFSYNNCVNSNGGVIETYNSTAKTNIYNSSFTHNKAYTKGGAISAEGKARVLISGCTFEDNTATMGGAISIGNAYVTLINTTIKNNTASSNGGGIYVSSNGSCLAKGTIITMSDGSSKAIEDIVEGDVIKTFNHLNGELNNQEVYFVYEGLNQRDYFTLNFTNDIQLNICGMHDLYEQSSKSYITITEYNYEDYIGKYFYNAIDQRWEELLSVTLSNDEVDYYSIYTKYNFNSISNKMLSLPDDVEYMLNLYEFDSNLLINEQQLQEDLDTYGEYPREWCELLNDDEYDYYKMKYINIAIGKGLITIGELTGSYEEMYDSPLMNNLLGSNTIDCDTYYIGENKNLIIGNNVNITNNKVNETRNNVELNETTEISIIDNTLNFNIGITINENRQDKTFIYSESLDYYKELFKSDDILHGIRVKDSETIQGTYDYYLGEPEPQPPILLIPHDVIFHNLEGINMELPTSIEFGTNISLEDIKPTKQGYIFEGFYRDSNYKYKVDTLVYNIVEEVYAKWVKYDVVNATSYIEDITFSNTYTLEEASIIINEYINENTELYALVYAPNKVLIYFGFDSTIEDYDFNDVNDINLMLSVDLNCVGFLGTPIKHKPLNITYELDGGTITNTDYSKSIEFFSNQIVLPTVIKEGYTLDGFYYNDNKIINNSIPSILEDMTITVKWIKNIEEPTLTETFVSRLYACFLRHKKYGYDFIIALKDDPDGVAYWTDELDRGIQTGASITYNFYLSDEYQSILKNEYNTQIERDSRFIKDLYRAMHGREAEDIGYNYWMNDLANGQTYKQVIDNISRSNEFRSMCKEHNIVPINE